MEICLGIFIVGFILLGFGCSIIFVLTIILGTLANGSKVKKD
jgi:TctA family transporter